MVTGRGSSLAAVLTLILVSVPAAGWASGEPYQPYLPDGATPAVRSTGSLLWPLVQFLFLFALVVGLVILATRFFGKTFAPFSRGRAMRVVDWTSLGQNRGLAAVEIGAKLYVLGVTEHQINLLTEIDDPTAAVRLRTPSEPSPGPAGGPRSWLTAWLRRLAPERRDGTGQASPGEFSGRFARELGRLRELAREEGTRSETTRGRAERDDDGND